MSRLGRAWARWVAATSRTETAETMALFRVGAAISVLWAVTSSWVSGASALVWRDASFGGYRDLGANWLIDLLGGPNPAVVSGLMATSLLGAALLALGLGGRAIALLTLQAYLPLTHLNTHANGSFEHLLTNALWLLVLCRSTATWSLDCRLRVGRWSSDQPIGAWARGLVLAQIVLVYGTTGLQKMGTSWTPIGGFRAVYYALRDPGWQRFDLPWLGWLEIPLAVSTAAIWLFETGWLLVPLLLWWTWKPGTGARVGEWVRRHDWRRGVLLFGGAMHLGILLLLEVGTFSWLTMSFYVALWRPSELRAAIARRWPRPA